LLKKLISTLKKKLQFFNFVVPEDTTLPFALKEISLAVEEGEGTSTISTEVGIFLLLLSDRILK
jgi:hypothetical protein